MSFELALRDAVAHAIQQELLPLLQPVLERLALPASPTKEDQDPLWTTRETAQYLKLSPITVEMWRSEGRGPSYLRIGNVVRYKKSVVVAFAEANKGLLGRRGRPPKAKVEEVKRSGLVVGGPHSQAGRARREGQQ